MLAPIISLSGVATFLSDWKQMQATNELDAPRRALASLGLLPDRNLFKADPIADRLLQNFELANLLKSMAGTELAAKKRCVKQDTDTKRRKKNMDILNRVNMLRRVGDSNSYKLLDFEEVSQLFGKVPRKPLIRPDKPAGPIEQVRNSLGVSNDTGAALIDGHDIQLTKMVKGVRKALNIAYDQEATEAKGSYQTSEGEVTFKFEINSGFLTWLKEFCNAHTWGGFYQFESSTFEEAVANYRQAERTPLRPLEPSLNHESNEYCLRDMLARMQAELRKQNVTEEDFCKLWDRIVAGRKFVLEHLDILVHQPMLAISGETTLREVISNLLKAWERLYQKLAAYYHEMDSIDPGWTRTLIETIAALDIVQIKTRLDSETNSWKAVLLPTHPLHLWRYERMAALVHKKNFDGPDRQAVLAEIKKPEHYLGVLYLTSFPKGLGGKQSLPVAKDYLGLAVFENFKNAYSGLDGKDSLQQCIRQFKAIYANHAHPLRLALINPPEASKLIVHILDESRSRGNTKSELIIDVYATPGHKARLKDARRFSTENRDKIEEHIRSGRLRLRIHDDCLLCLTKRLKELHSSPVHVVAVFDEATTSMRHNKGSANFLPMSPFAIRRKINYRGLSKRIELQPVVEETVFRSFYDMVGKMTGTIPGGTPQASADAERMAECIDETLLADNAGAFWFFFADRVLPTSSKMKSARILERRGCHRQVVCYDAGYERLALLLRQPLNEFNLRFSPQHLQTLLMEGVTLLGDGLIGLLKANGQPDTSHVRGLAGTLIAARDYKTLYPAALIVSVDSKIARLWLRLAQKDERCDLLALREEDDNLVVEVIEVKTASSNGGEVAKADIAKATQQITATLEAVKSGLLEDEKSPETVPLAAPRQEMLKEVLVAGCQSAIATDADRERWAEWLRMLFRDEKNSLDSVEFRGMVYAVELRNNRSEEDSSISNPGMTNFPIRLRCIREERIQQLVSSVQDIRGVDTVNSAADTSLEKKSHANAGNPRQQIAVERLTSKPDETVVGATSTIALAKPGIGSDTNSLSQGIRFCVGESTRVPSAQHYYLSPSNTRLNQLNIGIVGDLGTGKTQLTKALIYQFTQSANRNRGHRPNFLIFDYKKDYTGKDFVDAVNARVVEPHHIPLNVFDLSGIGTHGVTARLGRVKFLNDVLHKIYGGIGPRQRNQLKTAVLNAYEKYASSSPTLSDVLVEYEVLIGEKIDAPYSILSDLRDLEIFTPYGKQAIPFREFLKGVVVVDLSTLGVGDKERNMLVVLFLNFFHEYIQGLDKKPFVGTDPQLRFVDSMLLIDEADNIMKFNFDVLRQILLQGREFGVGVLLASQYLSHFKTNKVDYTEPLLTWFLHKVPNIKAKELEAIGLNGVGQTMIDRVKTQDVHQCLFKTFDVSGTFMRGLPFHEIVNHSE